MARVLAVVLLGFGLRLLRLSSLGDLEFDEIVSVRYASLPPDTLLARLSGALFEHPPLFYLMLGWWRAVAGESDVVARLFSVLPGTLMIPLAYGAGRRLFGERSGLIAAVVVALSPLAIFYSREARMYGLVACLGLASFWLFLRALERPRGPGHWIAYALTGAAAALVHYAGLLVVLAQPLAALLLPAAQRRRLRPVLATAGGVGLAAALWAAGSSGVRASLPALDLVYLSATPAALWRAWREMAGGPDFSGWWTAAAGLALLALALLGGMRAGSARALVLPPLLLGLAAVVIAVALGKPVQARYVLPAAPFVFLLAGAGAARWPAAGRPLLASTLVLGAVPFAATYYGGYQRADYSAITRHIATHERPDDAILLTGPWQAWYFDYYYPLSGGELLHRVLPENAPPALDPAQAAPNLARLASTRQRLWFVQAGLAQADPTNFVEGWLRANSWPALREAHQNAVLSLYALQPPEVKRPLRPVDFGGTVRLAGGWVDGEEVPAADVVRLSLELEALRQIDRPLKLSIRLAGADGQRIATDVDLADPVTGRPATAWRPGERVTVRQGVWLPVSTNPQPYDVRLVIYDASTLAPLTPSADTPTSPAVPGGEAPVGGLFVTQTRAAIPPIEGGYAPLDRAFGGGDEFDSFTLNGARWHQSNPAEAPLSVDLLWRLEGLTGTTHRSELRVTDDRGRVWLEESRPLFAGGFYMQDWREGETVGERRTLDLRTLPDGAYILSVRLVDARGRQLPVSGQPAAVELARYRLPYQRPLAERVQGLLQRLLARLPR